MLFLLGTSAIFLLLLLTVTVTMLVFEDRGPSSGPKPTTSPSAPPTSGPEPTPPASPDPTSTGCNIFDPECSGATGIPAV
ncbi:hypothetical protein ACFU96_21250 [Streptomyces sp. NPDC057620]|uniref:hypothetical protein n=1 Tax=Streptomyces sp. NPDC057620 TaxID=3346185 RepID=UPI0036A03A15